MNKTLVVYNTCGVTGRANDNYYLYAIDSLLKQNFDNYAVAVSSCMNSQATRDTLQSNFKQYISYNFIDELVPVSVSFNHTVLKCIEKYGEDIPEGYEIISEEDTVDELEDFDFETELNLDQDNIDLSTSCSVIKRFMNFISGTISTLLPLSFAKI